MKEQPDTYPELVDGARNGGAATVECAAEQLKSMGLDQEAAHLLHTLEQRDRAKLKDLVQQYGRKVDAIYRFALTADMPKAWTDLIYTCWNHLHDIERAR